MKVKSLKTRKLTEAAMLSALFVIVSLVAISTGIMYSMYLDMIVPIFISILYLRIGFKYTTLSSITSLLIVALAIGDVPSAIWMSQGIILGLICGFFIDRKSAILDDVLWSSILGCFIVVLVDVYFSTLTGYSLVKEFDSVAVMFPMLSEDILKMTFYIFVATVPVGTVLVVYIGTLFIGNKLNILNEATREKYNILKNFRKLGSHLCCSMETFVIEILYLLSIEIFTRLDLNINSTYTLTVLMSIRVVVLYFIIKDSYGFLSKYIYLKTKSRGITQMISFFILYCLLGNFYITTIILIVSSIAINLCLKLREKEMNIVNQFIKINMKEIRPH